MTVTAGQRIVTQLLTQLRAGQFQAAHQVWAESRCALIALQGKGQRFFQYQRSLAELLDELRKIPIGRPLTSTLIKRLLADKSDAKQEYLDSMIGSLTLDPGFAHRWTLRDNIEKLREAQRMGIHPEHVWVVCCECAKANWNTPTVSEVKDYAEHFRKIAKRLQVLLRKTFAPVYEVPERDRTSSSLVLLPKTAPRFSGYSGFTMLVPERFHAVREVADETEGLLEKCAQDLEAVIPALRKVNPSHHPKHEGKSLFTQKWTNLVNNAVGKQRNTKYEQWRYADLGAWFSSVTFGEKKCKVASIAKRASRSKNS
jgi:hypothetical protein